MKTPVSSKTDTQLSKMQELLQKLKSSSPTKTQEEKDSMDNFKMISQVK